MNTIEGLHLLRRIGGKSMDFRLHAPYAPSGDQPQAIEELVQGVLEDIRRKKLKVVPQCPFVATYIRRHPEWMDLVLTAENK